MTNMSNEKGSWLENNCIYKECSTHKWLIKDKNHKESEE